MLNHTRNKVPTRVHNLLPYTIDYVELTPLHHPNPPLCGKPILPLYGACVLSLNCHEIKLSGIHRHEFSVAFL